MVVDLSGVCDVVDLCIDKAGDMFESVCTWLEVAVCSVEREPEPLSIVADLLVLLERSRTLLGRVFVAACDVPKDIQ